MPSITSSSMPIATVIISPQSTHAGFSTWTGFMQDTAIVISALTERPGTSPVLLSSPLGTSIETTFADEALTASKTSDTRSSSLYL